MAEPRLTPVLSPMASAPAAASRRAHAGREAARRSFLRLASHELRTPLNAILGFSEIIAREVYGPVSEPRYREHADLIHDSGDRLLKLVTQLLDIARLELELMELDIRTEPVGAAFAAAARTVAREAAEAGVFLTFQVAPGAEWVRADARALTAALGNLLQNAVAAAPAGSCIRLEARLVRDGRLSLEVADAGPGVPPEQIARLLRPFEQGPASPSRFPGTGLGLPITRLLCQSMGGQLRLKPSPEGGLLAAVRLPAGAAPGAEDEAPSDAA